MSIPFAPIDDATADLLCLVADEQRPIGRDVPAIFLDACRADAAAHDGLVSVNRVRALLVDADIPPRRYSALWAHFTGDGKPMVKAWRYGEHGEEPVYETCRGSQSGNDGRPFQQRKWVGAL